MRYTVFEAGYGGPHSVKHMVLAKNAREAKRIVSRKIGWPMSELFAVRDVGKKAEQKFFASSV